ncbi:ABC transporter permease [Conexibacter sp. DBS9H8]|uniref:MlaE family ABC transporter permease n=1 Tax=Conexibacter sp. DBS9H8 TaxID=2937801 RepID=UPI00200E7EBE|nr:ABC transporter permease [Conexibacter sp. DBS9H8]
MSFTTRARGVAIPGMAKVESGLLEAGGMVMLGIQAARELTRGPYKWFGEFIEESTLILVRCSLPLILAVFAFGFGTIGVEAGGTFQALGAADRAGGVFVTAAVREVATWATAMVVAGVGGTAICADLGARKIREEIDAMRVLGINPIKQLVLPRMIALTIMTPLLNLVAILFITLSGILVMKLLFNEPSASFEATFSANFIPIELFASVFKTVIFGAIIAAVCCYKGLNAEGGAQGVGRAVNQAVVISFAALWIFNYAYTSVLLAQFPNLGGLR